MTTLYEHVRIFPLLPLDLHVFGGTTSNGEVVDTSGYATTMIAVVTGQIDDGSYTPRLYHSDWYGGWELVPDHFLQGSLPTITSASDRAIYLAGYVGPKRYLQIVIEDIAGVTYGGVMGIFVIAGQFHTLPVAQS